MISSLQTAAPSPELVARYNVPGPRYTSYPTALKFVPTEDADADMPELRPDRPVALYVHIPFCATLCRYCGCNQVISNRPGDADAYLDRLEREIALRVRRSGSGIRVSAMHFGGGTPSHLAPREIDRLAAMLRQAFVIGDDAEISVEMDPRRLDRGRVEAFHRLGCRRASLGVQDFDGRVQRTVARIQSFEETQNAVRWLRETGFSTVNFDLIYGLPYQTPETVDATMDKVLALDADRLAVFGYAHVPWMKPAQKSLERTGSLPGGPERLALFRRIFERLTAAGYEAIGLDHFAKHDDELARAFRAGTLQRDFQGYTTRPEPVMLGLGVTAISQSPEAFRQNEKDLPAYYAAIDAGRLPVAKTLRLTQEDRRRAHLIRTVMCAMRLDFQKLSAELGLDFEKTYAPELARLAPLEADGLIARTPAGYAVTPTGRFFLRNIAMVFDAYLDTVSGRHSKTV